MLRFANYMALKFDCRAVSALEYGLIAGLIVASVALGFTDLAQALSNQFVTIGSGL